MEKFLKVDFHVHTIYSPDSLSFLPRLIQVTREKELDRIVVTDHNTIRGAIEAKKIAPDLVIVGEEIMVEGGELLAAFVEEEVPQGLSPFRAVELLREQGAFISISHPFDTLRTEWDPGTLAELAPLLDAVEVFNARSWAAVYNESANMFAIEHHLPGTVGSDAHLPWELGKTYMELPDFNSVDELRASLPNGIPVTRLTPNIARLGSLSAGIFHLFYRAEKGRRNDKAARQ
jgi:predicted metal-dependent phosphoesterase TrpH